MTDSPTGRTPDMPDNDVLDEDTHHGESQQEASGRTPGTPDVDTQDEDVQTGNDETEL